MNMPSHQIDDRLFSNAPYLQRGGERLATNLLASGVAQGARQRGRLRWSLTLVLILMNLLIAGVEWQVLERNREEAILDGERRAARDAMALAGSLAVFLQEQAPRQALPGKDELTATAAPALPERLASIDPARLRGSIPLSGSAVSAYLLSRTDDDWVPSVQLAGVPGVDVSQVFIDARAFLARTGRESATLRLAGAGDDMARIMAWRGVGNYPLLVAVLIPDSEYLAGWRDHRAMLLRFHALVLGLSLLLVVLQRLSWRPPKSVVADAVARKEAASVDAASESGGQSLLHLHLQQKIKQARHAHKVLAVCHLNIDDFESINARYGRPVGDRLLVSLGAFLRQALRRGDLVVHLGRDEFALVLSPLDTQDECEMVLNRVMAAFAEPIRVDSLALPVSPSIGVSVFPADDNDATTLLRHADRAMNRAKHQGGNRYAFFDPLADTSEKCRRQIIAQIRQGIANGEFRLFYQPKVDIEQGSVLGFEALIRWQHPEDGLLLPGHFLPLIEEDDLIVDLGYWTLQAALADLALWHRAGFELRVSVNMATRHLQQPGFTERLAELLAAHPELPKWALELEILETSNLADLTHAAAVVEACVDLGVAFALDDFGTGYSSLTYFRKLPVQSLKIDQTFVRDMLADPEDFSIAEGLVQLGRSFSRTSIAEGVEDIETGMLLKAMGCHVLQGYGIARPMPAERIFPWLSEWPDPRWAHACAWPGEAAWVPLIVAEGHHRRWANRLVASLEGGEKQRPELDAERCYVGRWCFHKLIDSVPGLQVCDGNRRLHEELHAQAADMLALLDAGQGELARAQLPRFLHQSEMLCACLRELRQQVLGIEASPLPVGAIHVS